jgi:low affinity Fe/Cu permease
MAVARHSSQKKAASRNEREPKVRPEALVKPQPKADAAAGTSAKANSNWFHWFAVETSRLSGRPIAFAGAVALVVGWGLTGPLFGFSDTWQLVINTGTTIVTFLMVFLIQHTQNRDSLAFQVKLAELIIAARGAENKVAVAEDMTDEELEALHETYCQRATETLESLKARRGDSARERSVEHRS